MDKSAVGCGCGIGFSKRDINPESKVHDITDEERWSTWVNHATSLQQTETKYKT